MGNIRKVWIVGVNGRLGQAINQLLDRREIDVLNTDIDDVDITDSESLMMFGDMNRPDVIINCAGLTDVEICEREVERAYKVNALGARNLSIVAFKIGARFIHISTDDVFSGESKVPYREFDTPHPKSVYGKSKLAGEHFVKDFVNKYIIIRSSWVYGEGENFIKALLERAKTQKLIQIADDQFGSPTSAIELAKLVIKLMNTVEYGLYHGTCEGQCSRYEFAQEILRLAVTVALSVAKLINPGIGLDMSSIETAEVTIAESQSLADVLLDIIPKNPIGSLAAGDMLPIIFFTLLIGIILAKQGDRVDTVANFFSQFNNIMMDMTMMVMKVAPVGVFCLIAKTFAGIGFDGFLPMFKYMGAVFLALGVQCFIVYMILLKVCTGLNPITFIKKFLPVMGFAFSTATSNATIPLSIETLDKKWVYPNVFHPLLFHLGQRLIWMVQLLCKGLLLSS